MIISLESHFENPTDQVITQQTRNILDKLCLLKENSIPGSICAWHILTRLNVKTSNIFHSTEDIFISPYGCAYKQSNLMKENWKQMSLK